MTALRQRMLEDLQIRNYAPTTIRGYILQVAQFAKHFGKSPDQLGAEHIRAYQLFLVKESGLSQSTYIQVVSALRFLYTQTLNRQVSIDRIPFPISGYQLQQTCGTRIGVHIYAHKTGIPSNPIVSAAPAQKHVKCPIDRPANPAVAVPSSLNLAFNNQW